MKGLSTLVISMSTNLNVEAYNDILGIKLDVLISANWRHWILMHVTAVPCIFHCVVTKALSSATSWSFSEEHLTLLQLAKNALMDTLIEYLLLDIWPIKSFLHLYNILEPNLRKWTRIFHCLPGQARSCNSLAGIMHEVHKHTHIYKAWAINSMTPLNASDWPLCYFW